jgi:Flp pilus assembly CpaE family ATPase
MNPAQDLGHLLLLDPGQLTSKEVMRRVTQHASGLRVLVAPQHPTNYLLTAAHVEPIVGVLAQEAEYLILDLPTIADEAIHQAVDQADQVLLVTEPEAVSVACARDDLEMLKSWGVFDRTNLVIVSRTPASSLIAPRDIEKQLGVRIMGVLPPAPEMFYLAARSGNPVVLSKPDTLAANSLVKLTETLLERLPVTVS